MDTTVSTVKRKPMTMAEMFSLSGIAMDVRQTLTARKQPRLTIAATRTSEKVKKPLTIAEMSADIQALKPKTPKRNAETIMSNKKKWNSSVKVDKKTINHMANGHIKKNSVRKLDFQLQNTAKVTAKSRPPKMSMMPNSSATMNPEASKFHKPELKVKQSIHVQAHIDEVEISGFHQIPETPIYKVPNSRMTIANKENVPSNLNQQAVKKLAYTPKQGLLKKVVIRNIPATPMSNASSCDDSFLQKEKEIDIMENKINACDAISEEQTFENISEVSPPVSTPFKKYRNVTDFFNNSSAMEDSNDCNDNTIMVFDDPPNSNENRKREESVIVSLCDMFNQATVSNKNKTTTELDDLLDVKKQTENTVKMIDNAIETLQNIKESHLKTLQYVNKLMQETKKNLLKPESDKIVIEITKESPKTTNLNNTLVSRNPLSVIKRSPAYKCPKKNTCLGKKIFHKSMPSISNITPKKDMGDKAYQIYMKMKENMQFLSTPSVRQRTEVPDTPAITSQNLQKQLDKLYRQS